MDTDSGDEHESGDEQIMEMDCDDSVHVEDSKPSNRKVYIPNMSRPLREGEELEYEAEAYRIYERLETPCACLSFDVIPDRYGELRTKFPLSCLFIGGTEASKSNENHLYMMKVSNIMGKDHVDNDDSDSSDEEGDGDKPHSTLLSMQQHGTINRIKVTPLGDSTACGIFNDLGKIKIYNLTNPMEQLYNADEKDELLKASENPLFSHDMGVEGYGLSWSPLQEGKLAVGDNHGRINLFKIIEGGKWVKDSNSLIGHKNSVEDLVWSPSEDPLLASCSVDKTIRLWDTRLPSKTACVCVVENAHGSDVNVLAWNKIEPLIVTGGDDGALKVWSLKMIQEKEPVAVFKYHKKPITSVEWLPSDSTTFMASGEDNQITFWDLSLESDTVDDIAGIPPQLLFIHLGQNEIKEVHWHHQIPGLAISTALDSFNVFQPVNIS